MPAAAAHPSRQIMKLYTLTPVGTQHRSPSPRRCLLSGSNGVEARRSFCSTPKPSSPATTRAVHSKGVNGPSRLCQDQEGICAWVVQALPEDFVLKALAPAFHDGLGCCKSRRQCLAERKSVPTRGDQRRHPEADGDDFPLNRAKPARRAQPRQTAPTAKGTPQATDIRGPWT